MRIDIWSDVVCPWCYIGKRRFEQALERFPHREQVEVVHRAFQLDPTFPKGETTPTVEMLGKKYGGGPAGARQMMARVEQVAAEVGLDYHLAETLSGNTLDAHRLLHLARARGVQDAVLERLYRAYFTEGRSLFDHKSLADLAADAGLDREEALRTLRSDAYADAAGADHYEARALGISGVPFFVVDGKYGISGAQPTELFAQALAQATPPGEHAPTSAVPTSAAASEAVPAAAASRLRLLTVGTTTGMPVVSPPGLSRSLYALPMSSQALRDWRGGTSE
jgi:predicted DsbA family dithiol-disulfide isomerase